MDISERVQQGEFLGREFLLWLWFKSETEDGLFDLEDMGTVEIRPEDRITLESSSDQGTETITCSGDNLRLKEARFALTENKQVTQATIRLIRGDDEWRFTLDSTWMNFKALKTPKIMQDFRDDPEGLFYEKIFLLEQPVSIMNAVFALFIKKRLSSEWKTKELPALSQWVGRGKAA